MQPWSDPSSSTPHGPILSSSFPSQARISRYPAAPVGRPYLDPSLAESSPTHHRLSQPNRQQVAHGIIQRPPPQRQQQQNQQQQDLQSERHRRTTSLGSRQSLVSQPVIVRTYSAEADDNAGRQSAMHRRLGSNSSRTRPNMVPAPIHPPPAEDFGIEGILRAIEPEIQSTIDAIAEICGRSRLSLANEYGSHRPPLGEIRATSRTRDHGLLTVEEASSSTERLAGGNVFVVGDDISTLDGRESYTSTYNILESLRARPGAVRPRAPAPPAWDENQRVRPQSSRRRAASTKNSRPSTTGKSAQKPARSSNPLLWSVLGYQTEPGEADDRKPQFIRTQPVLSEVHLDVEADRHQQAELDADRSSFDYDNESGDKSLIQTVSQRLSLLSDLQGLLAWCKRLSAHGDPVHGVRPPSAATKLRAVLEQDSSRDGPVEE